VVTRIWADIFGLTEIGLDADFFNLDGASLRAAVLGVQIHAALGIEPGRDRRPPDDFGSGRLRVCWVQTQPVYVITANGM